MMKNRFGVARVREMGKSLVSKRPVVSVLHLEGTIMAGGPPRNTVINFRQMAPLVEKAFSRGKPAAVALRINSPGGSPVQSSLIARRIRELASEKTIPVHTFVEDVAASGGYWLAVAGDTIHLDNNSIVGSIGVVSSMFGFHRFLEHHGIERRLFMAGKDKGMLDPFQPLKQGDVERLKEIQRHVHDSFIAHVKERRGDAIGENDVYTGHIYAGEKAIAVGLADHVGHLVPVMKDMYGDKVKFNHYAAGRKLFGFIGTRFMASMLDLVEDRLARSQYGL